MELGSFTTENTNFSWDKFRYDEYKVVLENVNIHKYLSIRCLNWFMAYGFKVIINSSSYASLGALEEFIEGAPKRHPSAFADLISMAGCPNEGGYSGMGRSDRVKSLLMEKGYTFTSKDRR